MDTGSRHNPFSNHILEPARGGYIFAKNTPADLNQVLSDLEKHAWRGALTGPHGAGKSTLLTDICAALKSRGVSLARWQCRDTDRSFPKGWIRDLFRAEVVVIDGAERLLFGLLPFVRTITALTGRGLIITTHLKINLGATVMIAPDPAALQAKLRAIDIDEMTIASVAQKLEEHRGDCRQTLFDLYLQYESKCEKQQT